MTKKQEKVFGKMCREWAAIFDPEGEKTKKLANVPKKKTAEIPPTPADIQAALDRLFSE